MLGRVQVSFTGGQDHERVHERVQASREGSGESADGRVKPTDARAPLRSPRWLGEVGQVWHATTWLSLLVA